MATPSKEPHHHPTYTGGARPNGSTQHLLDNPSPNLNQGQRRNQIQLTTPIDGSMQRWRRPYTCTTTLKGKASGTLKPYNGPVGRWQHSGCPLTNMRPWVGGMPHPGLADSALQISCSTSMPLAQGISGHEAGEDPDFSPDAAGLYQEVRGPNRCYL